jgi:hypothetical protein
MGMSWIDGDGRAQLWAPQKVGEKAAERELMFCT